MSSIYDTYDNMLNIIEVLEDKINYLETHLLNSLQSKVKMNNNYIEMLETKLKTEFNKNDELKVTVISLESRLKQQMDELFSMTYCNKNICIADIKITNDAIQLFEDKLQIEFAKNDDLKRQVSSLENQLIDKNIDHDYEDLRSCSKKIIRAFNIALDI